MREVVPGPDGVLTCRLAAANLNAVKGLGLEGPGMGVVMRSCGVSAALPCHLSAAKSSQEVRGRCLSSFEAERRGSEVWGHGVPVCHSQEGYAALGAT